MSCDWMSIGSSSCCGKSIRHKLHNQGMIKSFMGPRSRVNRRPRKRIHTSMILKHKSGHRLISISSRLARELLYGGKRHCKEQKVPVDDTDMKTASQTGRQAQINI
eukprot:1156899-Pelagomonas_calceolata.AAC.6